MQEELGYLSLILDGLNQDPECHGLRLFRLSSTSVRSTAIDFEHEATYDRMSFVNDAVYIAKYDEQLPWWVDSH